MKFNLKMITKGILIALCICIVVLLAVGLIDRILFEPESIFARTVKGFEEQKDQIQILFLGQSDIKHAIIPKAMPYKSYNFAEMAETFIGTYFKLKYYIDKTPQLKIIVLPLHFSSFSTARSKGLKDEHLIKYFSYGYITYQDLKELYKIMGFKVVRLKLASLSPWLDRGRMKVFFENARKWIRNKPLRTSEIYDGYFFTTSSFVNEEHAEQTIQRHFGRNQRNDFDKDLLSYFEKILILCHKRGIKVVTLTIPMTDIYIKLAEKYITQEALCEKVFTNPRFSPYIYRHLDYLDLYAKDHALFFNLDHLNYKGATVFSERMASDVSRIMEEIKMIPGRLK
jgi:hypothetical protein